MYIHVYIWLCTHVCVCCREFLMPGLVDTHIHAPQYVYAGTAMDLPLLQWLNQYTFPIEASFSDSGVAQDAYTRVVVSAPRMRTLLTHCGHYALCTYNNNAISKHHCLTGLRL